MSFKHTRVGKLLVVYYGMLQMLHIIMLVRAAVVFARSDSIGFPALPPTGGWTLQAQHFLIATGLVDALNVGLALLFVYGVFRNKYWSLRLGLVTLTITLYSAVVFVYGTFMSNAWQANPLGYGLVAVIFFPALILTAVVYYQAFLNSESEKRR